MTPAGKEHGETFRLLTRLFLRRLIDNDLLSPHADRHESLAVAYGVVVSLGVFATFFLSTNYLAAFIQLPGPAALSALSDRFLFIAASMSISALGALVVWDALALEPRDTAILGPLPIAARTITRAKLAAVATGGAVLAVALNGVPSVLYPVFLTLNIRGTRGTTVLQLIGAHATTVTMAGLFGFFAILGVRGVLRLLFGEQGFPQVSSAAQSALVVSMVTALLTAPTVRAIDVRGWASSATTAPQIVRPTLWYLGINETAAGHLVNETPVVLPPRFSFLRFPKQQDDAARAAYRALQPGFKTLARRGWVSLPLVTALALVTFLWTNRRLPERSAGAPAGPRIRTAVRQIAERATSGDPEAQAGFFFALQTLARSAPHRTIVSIAAASGVTYAFIVLAHSGSHSLGLSTPSAGVFGISTALLLSVLAGVAYAVTVPAEPAANWLIRMAWLGDERAYLAGVKRAAMVLAATVLLVLLPLHIALLGMAKAVAHSMAGLVLAAAMLDALFLSHRKLPFACTYVPIENPKLAWPAAISAWLLVTSVCANIEQWALQAVPRTVAAGLALAAVALFLRTLDRTHRRERRAVAFDDGPVQVTQRLGLFEHIGEA